MQTWKQAKRMMKGNLVNSVTTSYLVWRAKRAENAVAPKGMISPPTQKPSELDLLKQELAAKEKAWKKESGRL